MICMFTNKKGFYEESEEVELEPIDVGSISLSYTMGLKKYQKHDLLLTALRVGLEEWIEFSDIKDFCKEMRRKLR